VVAPLVVLGRLPRGQYHATLVAVRADGTESVPAELQFEIV
jgi:hypothetical protein